MKNDKVDYEYLKTATITTHSCGNGASQCKDCTNQVENAKNSIKSKTKNSMKQNMQNNATQNKTE